MTKRVALRCSSRTRIYSERHDAWRLATSDDAGPHVRDVNVALAIVGDERNGFHLNMTPDGCFTADYWYGSKNEALEAAIELFGVRPDEWTSA